MFFDNFMRRYTEELADQTCYLPQSQNADTGPTSPRTDPILHGICQSVHQIISNHRVRARTGYAEIIHCLFLLLFALGYTDFKKKYRYVKDT